MKTEVKGNIFDEKADAVCVTTNGIVCRTGAVMGAGIAKEANMRYNLSASLGKKLKETGNHVYDMGVFDNKHVITFPTKNDWRDPSDIALIKQSCIELITLADANNWKEILLPPVGCGCGGLNFEKDVKPVIGAILDDRFTICLYKH